MNDITRSVAVGAAFAVGGLVVAAVAIAVVRARQQRLAVVVDADAAEPQPAKPSEPDAASQSGIESAAGLPADMRPADPSHGPVV